MKYEVYKTSPSQDELYHHGVKGMKWGVRRYQNEDGSLTDKGKKRIGRMYDKYAKKSNAELAKRYNSMYLKAYNKAADYMNSGGIEKFNSEQRKKHGDNYAQRDGYMDDYQRRFNNKIAKYMDTSVNDFYTSNKSFQKSQELVSKYNMTDWHEMAKNNANTVNELRRNIELDQYD